APFRSHSEFWAEEANFQPLLDGAARGGSLEILSTLLALCPSADVWTPEKVTWVLGGAVSGGSFEVFSNILAIDGFPPLSGIEYDRRSIRMLLDRAAEGGNGDILLALLEMDGFGAEVRDVGDSHYRNFSALYTAALFGNLGVVAALIQAGAPLEYRWLMNGLLGETALSVAVRTG
ncbi:unnamed protein product, partial [Ectocarpus fasciculatus]